MIPVILLFILGLGLIITGLLMFIESFQYHMTWNTTFTERFIERFFFISLFAMGVSILLFCFGVI